MAEGGCPQSGEDAAVDEIRLISQLPSIPSSDDVPGNITDFSGLGSFEESGVERKDGQIQERLCRLKGITHGIIATQKFRRKSSIQGKYVAITPNERDNLEHIQHMTEDITARLGRLRDEGDESGQTSGDLTNRGSTEALYVPKTVDVQGKFVEFVPFDGCMTRPETLGLPASEFLHPALDISPLPPLPPMDSFAFMNGDGEDMDDFVEDEEGAAEVTASLEQRLRNLSDGRGQ